MLEIRPYPYAELSQMMGTHDPEGISRRLDRWGVAFTEDGRKPQITYNIEKISDPFKVYCMPYIGKYIGRPQRKKAKLMKLVPFKSIAW